MQLREFFIDCCNLRNKNLIFIINLSKTFFLVCFFYKDKLDLIFSFNLTSYIDAALSSLVVKLYTI